MTMSLVRGRKYGGVRLRSAVPMLVREGGACLSLLNSES